MLALIRFLALLVGTLAASKRLCGRRKRLTRQGVVHRPVLSFIWVLGCDRPQSRPSWEPLRHLQQDAMTLRLARTSLKCVRPPKGTRPHLQQQLPVGPAVAERRSVVVVIQHGDVSRAGGAPGGRSPVLDHHHQLVARLLLSVQAQTGADLP